jgi:hypothetical protein
MRALVLDSPNRIQSGWINPIFVTPSGSLPRFA